MAINMIISQSGTSEAMSDIDVMTLVSLSLLLDDEMTTIVNLSHEAPLTSCSTCTEGSVELAASLLHRTMSTIPNC